jgi:hypothetical protein
MKNFLFGLTIFMASASMILSANADEPCDASDECTYSLSDCKTKKPIWFSVDALFLNRSQKFSGNLVLDEDNNLAPVLTGNDLSFGTVAGPRFAGGIGLTECLSLEGVYFGLHDWSATGIALGNNNRSIPGDLRLATFDYFAADAIQAGYGSRIQNVEANLWRSFGKVDVLGGFRHFGMFDDFRLATFDADTFQSDYRIDTKNHLYGGQVGLRLNFVGEYFSFRPEAKFGVFGNSNGQSSAVRDLNNTLLLRDADISGGTTSTLSELRLVGDCQLTKCFSVNYGYNLLWATNLAQAPYQLDFTDTIASSRFIDDSHSVFLHGASVGLTFSR